MGVHRPSFGAWVAAIALLAVACGGGTDRSAAGVEPIPAAPTDPDPDHDPALDHDHDHDPALDHDHELDPDPDHDSDLEERDDGESGLSVTEATIAAMAAMDPDALAALHQHDDDHAGHDMGPRDGLNSVDPERIVIPAIGVDARTGRAGIDPDGQMQVPDFGDTAWFTPSVKPGRIGPSVITGHVDSKQGPDVFFGLKDLVAGDRIAIHGHNGDIVTFAVSAIEQHPKNDYPRQRVHGATKGPELRLITCGGIFDPDIGHYDDNIIVYAERVTGA